MEMGEADVTPEPGAPTGVSVPISASIYCLSSSLGTSWPKYPDLGGWLSPELGGMVGARDLQSPLLRGSDWSQEYSVGPAHFGVSPSGCGQALVIPGVHLPGSSEGRWRPRSNLRRDRSEPGPHPPIACTRPPGERLLRCLIA